jgi:hypothetical protein
MSEARLLRLRGLVGWLATLLCLGALLSLADSFVDSFRTGPDTFSMLVGGQESLSGPMPKGADKAESLTIAIDRPGLRLDVTTEAQGFWFGNRMWQGKAQAPPDATPGTFIATLRGPADPPDKPAQTFTLHVYADQRSLDAAAYSRIRRWLGMPPMLLAAICIVLALIPGTCVFFLSRKVEALREREGRAEIYKLKKTPEGLQVTFGLGAKHGLREGEAMTVRDRKGLVVASAKVVRCAATESDALVTGEGDATCGDMISRDARA